MVQSSCSENMQPVQSCLDAGHQSLITPHFTHIPEIEHVSPAEGGQRPA
jgi:hypothetical protein